MNAEEIAQLFHNHYELLAPSFGYETRKDTKQFDPESPNGKLMIAVCGSTILPIIDQDHHQLHTKIKEAIDRLRDKKFPLGEREWCRECSSRFSKDLSTAIDKIMEER